MYLLFSKIKSYKFLFLLKIFLVKIQNIIYYIVQENTEILDIIEDFLGLAQIESALGWAITNYYPNNKIHWVDFIELNKPMFFIMHGKEAW